MGRDVKPTLTCLNFAHARLAGEHGLREDESHTASHEAEAADFRVLALAKTALRQS